MDEVGGGLLGLLIEVHLVVSCDTGASALGGGVPDGGLEGADLGGFVGVRRGGLSEALAAL